MFVFMPFTGALFSLLSLLNVLAYTSMIYHVLFMLPIIGGLYRGKGKV